MNYHELLKQISEQVAVFYFEKADEGRVFHKPRHTMELLYAVEEMASHYGLDARDSYIVCSAAWFLDTGYHIVGKEGHEIKSAEMAETCLQRLSAEDIDITGIKNCILSTRLPQKPQLLTEKIMCDAVFFYLGNADFKEKNKVLKAELEYIQQEIISGTNWRSSMIDLMESHKFHTDYCEQLLKAPKRKNLERLKQKQENKLSSYPETEPLPEPLSDSQAAPKSNFPVLQPMPPGTANPAADKTFRTQEKQEKKTGGAFRGTETMFRVSSSNHQRMSSLADNKANIMISVNTIIISIIIALLLPKFETNTQLIVPTIILLLINITTIIYSILATRPKMHTGIFTPEQVENKTVNLLFFGSFYKMNFKEYKSGMQEMMNDSDFLYSSLIKDIYWQGRVMGRKFRLLRIAYDIFMYGLAVAVIAFALAALLIK
ncbi:MAG: Pycsar system effector family protein [Ferruginibacter sp.]